jgi:hypothetical protein
VAYNQTVFGHADLINQQNGSGLVPRWRLHPDYRNPLVGRKLLQGLWREAAQRDIGRLIILADRSEVAEDLEQLGIPRDRAYHRLLLDDTLDKSWRRGPAAETIPTGPCLEPVERTDFSWHPFLGLPLNFPYIATRARMAFDYRLPYFQKPDFFLVKWEGQTYAACFDGREWFVLRRERSPGDAEAVAPVLRRLLHLHPGEIRLSAKTLLASGLTAPSQADAWDHFTDQPV